MISLPSMTRAVRRSGGRLARCLSDSTQDSASVGALEELLAPREHVVEGVLKVRRALGELATHLVHVFLVALLDLFPEKLLQRAVAQTLLALLGKVRDDVRHERACQSLRLRVRVVGEERIDGWSGRRRAGGASRGGWRRRSGRWRSRRLHGHRRWWRGRSRLGCLGRRSWGRCERRNRSGRARRSERTGWRPAEGGT